MTASVVVSFTNPEAAAASNAHLSAEVDSRPTGLNGGNSNFLPGGSAYLLVYKSANVNLLSSETSAGTFVPSGSATVEIKEELQFVDTDNVQLRLPADNRVLTSYKWIGRDLGVPRLALDGKTVIVNLFGVGVLKVVYNATATVGKLSVPPSVSSETDFNVLVVIRGEVIEA